MQNKNALVEGEHSSSIDDIDLLPFGEKADLLAKMEGEMIDKVDFAWLLGIGKRTLETWDAKGSIPKGEIFDGMKFWNLTEIRVWEAAGRPSRASTTGEVA